MYCKFSPHPEGFYLCPNCGYRIGHPVIRICPEGNPKPIPPSSPKKKGLGDWIAYFLSTTGLTEEKYIEIKKSIGLPPWCNCQERRDWLNKLGEQFGEATRISWEKVTHRP